MSTHSSKTAGVARCALVLTACIVGVFLISGHSQSQTTDARTMPLESLVPANSLVYFSVCDLAQSKEAFKQTALWKIWKDEEVQFAYDSIVKNFQKEIDRMKEEFEKETGEKLDTVLEILDGQLSFALVDFDPEAKEEDKPPVKLAFAIDVKDKKDVAQRLLNRIYEKTQTAVVVYDCPGEHAGWVREPSPGKCSMCQETLVMREELPRGTHITEASVEGIEFKMVDEKPPLYYGFLGGTLVGVTDEALLKEMIGRFKANSVEGSLTTSPAYQGVKERVGGAGLAFFLYAASADEFLARAEKEIDEDGERVIEALGLRTIKGLALGAEILPDGTVSEAVYLYAPDERKGITALPSYIRPCEVDFSMTPMDAMSAATVDIDLAGLYTKIMDIVKGCAGEEWPEIEQEIQKFEKEAGISIEKDLLGSIGRRIHMVSMPMEGGGLLPGGFFVLDLKDPANFERTFAAIATYRGKYEVKTMPFKGREIKFLSRLPEIPREPVFVELDANQVVARTQIETVKLVIDNYRIVEGKLPTDLQSLVPDWLEELPLDPWGSPYMYEYPGKEGDFDLTSYGADGLPDGEGAAGDITNHNAVGSRDFGPPPEMRESPRSGEEMLAFMSLTSLPSCYFINGNKCFMSSMAQALKDVIRALDAGSLPARAESHPLKAMVAKIPRGTAMQQVSDLRPFLAPFYNTLLQGLAVVEPIVEATTPMPVQIDTATFPSSTAIAQHITPQIGWLLSDKDGFSYHVLSSTGMTVVGLSTAAIVAAIAVPAVLRAKESATAFEGDAECAHNLKQIGTYLFLYQSRYGSETGFPPGTGREFLKNLLVLPSPETSVYAGMEALFRCRQGDPLPPEGISYRGPAEELKNPNGLPQNTVMACDSPMNHRDESINVLYMDGHVEKVYPGTDEYNRVLETTKE